MGIVDHMTSTEKQNASWLKLGKLISADHVFAPACQAVVARRGGR